MSESAPETAGSGSNRRRTGIILAIILGVYILASLAFVFLYQESGDTPTATPSGSLTVTASTSPPPVVAGTSPTATGPTTGPLSPEPSSPTQSSPAPSLPEQSSTEPPSTEPSSPNPTGTRSAPIGAPDTGGGSTSTSDDGARTLGLALLLASVVAGAWSLRRRATGR